MKSKQLILTVAIALSVVGCQNDEAKIKTLEDLTAGQTAEVMKQNEALRSLATQIETCQAELAELKGEPAVIKYEEVGFDVPTLMGEAKVEPKAKVETLEQLKTSLAQTLDKQAAKLTELEAAADQCSSDLAAAKAKADSEKTDAEAAAGGSAE